MVSQVFLVNSLNINMGWSWGPWSPQSLPSSLSFSMTPPYICLFLQLFSSFLSISEYLLLLHASLPSHMYSFTIDVVTNDHKLGGLARNVFSHKSGGQTSEIKGQQVHTLSWGSRGESVPGLLQVLVTASIPWLVTTSLQSLPLWSHCLLLFLWFPFKRTFVI